MLLMLKKGISKVKLFADLNMMIKRGKIAGKSLHSLLFHHHHNWAATTFNRHPQHLPSSSSDEYEFTHKHYHHDDNNNNNNMYINIKVMKALEDMITSATSSPGIAKSPMVKQIRITDSPYPLTNGDDDGKVDEDAEKFILRFYNGLKREN
ncbi:uncharacterized protein LOC143616724 [Bidens hawaiensis]|uniref:uncharacterized protein LOC143616724 n=1 Tax=Bidens hawaiensis TaxID=980011 RepID=UPI00404B9C2D